MRWLVGGLLGLGAVSWWLPSGPVVAVLRLALGLGAAAALLGVGLGWLLAFGAYSLGVSSVRWAARGAEVLLALPWVVFMGLFAQGWRGEVRFMAALGLLLAARSGVALLDAARALEVAPCFEGVRALGGRRSRVFTRHLGPWLVPLTLRLGVEGAAAAAPLDLLLSFAGVGSGLQAELAQAALAGQRRGELLLACGSAAVLGGLLVALGERGARVRGD